MTADGRHDLDAMAAAITDRTKVVIVCTPNNPTGPAVTQSELDAFIAKVPTHVVVVVDEAYLEFVRMDDAIDGDRDLPAPRQRRADPHLLQGLRPRRLPGRVRRRSRAARRPRSARSRCRSASATSPRPPRSPRWARRPSCSSGSRTSSRAAPTWSPGCARSGWDLPDAQGNFVWFPLGDRALDFAAACGEVGDLGPPVRRRRRPREHRRGARPSTASSRWPPASPADRPSVSDPRLTGDRRRCQAVHGPTTSGRA